MNLHGRRPALWLFVALISAAMLGLSCSSLPTFVPDLAHGPARPVPLDGAQGPLSAERSRAILTQMRNDEIVHGQQARDAGGIELPAPVRSLMRATSRLMTTTASHF